MIAPRIGEGDWRIFQKEKKKNAKIKKKRGNYKLEEFNSIINIWAPIFFKKEKKREGASII